MYYYSRHFLRVILVCAVPTMIVSTMARKVRGNNGGILVSASDVEEATSHMSWSAKGKPQGFRTDEVRELQTDINCPNDCGDHGTCLQFQDMIRCKCDLGYTGPACTRTICSLLGDCSGHGECRSPLEGLSEKEKRSKIVEFISAVKSGESFESDIGCQCQKGWHGMACEKTN